MPLKYDYLNEFIDQEHHVQYDLERKMIHEIIIDKYLENKQSNVLFAVPQILFTSGCYGSGKSHVLHLLEKNNKIKLSEWTHVDPDIIRSYIPEYFEYLKQNPWTAGSKTNNEACYLAELIQLILLFNGKNIIMDGSMKDHVWYTIYIQWLKNKFVMYKTTILHVKTTWELILERNLLRAEQTKRSIPLKLLKSTFGASYDAFIILRKIVDESFIINNNDSDNLDDIANFHL